MADLFDGGLTFSAHGYDWSYAEALPHTIRWSKNETKAFAGERVYLVELGDLCKLDFQTKSFDPLGAEHRTLFQDFAALKVSPDGIKVFANKYGMLGDPYTVQANTYKIKKRTSQPAVVSEYPQTHIRIVRKQVEKAEPYWAWVMQIIVMRVALEVWALINKLDETPMRRYILTDEKGFRLIDPSTGYFVTARYPWWMVGCGGLITVAGEQKILARFLLKEIINANIKGKFSPVMTYGLDSDNPAFRIIPNSLLAALWLQFAQAVDKSHTYKQCERCGKWFDVAKKMGARADKKWCGGACKKAAYRAGKKLKARA